MPRTGLAHDFAHQQTRDDFVRTFAAMGRHLRLASYLQLVSPPQQAPALIEQAPPDIRRAWAHAVANLAYGCSLVGQALRLTLRETPRLCRSAYIRASQPGVRLGVIGWAYGAFLTALCVWR